MSLIYPSGVRTLRECDGQSRSSLDAGTRNVEQPPLRGGAAARRCSNLFYKAGLLHERCMQGAGRGPVPSVQQPRQREEVVVTGPEVSSRWEVGARRVSGVLWRRARAFSAPASARPCLAPAPARTPHARIMCRDTSKRATLNANSVLMRRFRRFLSLRLLGQNNDPFMVHRRDRFPRETSSTMKYTAASVATSLCQRGSSARGAGSLPRMQPGAHYQLPEEGQKAAAGQAATG